MRAERIFAGLCLLLAVMLAGCVNLGRKEEAPVDLATLKRWDIAVPLNAAPAETYAAQEFQHWLNEAIGASLPIVTNVSKFHGHVFIGFSPAMRRSPAGFSPEGLGPEDLRIVVKPGYIAIAGGSPRGTLYGVYTFLEDYFGVRFSVLKSI